MCVGLMRTGEDECETGHCAVCKVSMAYLLKYVVLYALIGRASMCRWTYLLFGRHPGET